MSITTRPRHFVGFRKHIRSALWALICLAGSPAWSQSSASPFTSGIRFDAAKRVVGEIQPDPDGAGSLRFGAVRYSYDTRGLLTSVESGELYSWQSESVRPTDWTGFTAFRRTDYSYDNYGRMLSRQLSSGGTIFQLTQFSYDNVGRLDCVAKRMNPSVFVAALNLSACALGNQGSYGPDRITKFTYDSSDRRLTTTLAFGTAIQQNYVTNTYVGAHLASSRDSNGNVSTYQVDGFGRVEYWNLPSPSSVGATSSTDCERYGYDANGNRTQVRRRNGNTIYYAYDALNRVTSKDLPGSNEDTSYTYDLRGHLLTARFTTTGAGTTNVVDGFGRLASSTTTMGGVSRSIYSDYDADGNRTRITHPDGNYFDYAYDGLGRVTHICENSSQICSGAANPIVTQSYNPRGMRSQLTRGTSVSLTAYGYDAISRLSSISHDLDGGNTISDVTDSLVRNPANQIVTRTVTNNVYEFSSTESSRHYTSNGLNQYTQITSPTSVSLDYDGNGNLTYDGATTFGYDTENRMISASGAKNATLSYDPDGRLFQTTGSTTTQFLYDGSSLVVEYAANGSILRRYVSGSALDEPLIWYEGDSVGANNRRYVHADHHGSVIAVSNSAGETLEKSSYDPYGIQGASISSRFQYTGQAYIPELGLYYYKARMYSASLGRFMQTDPVGYADNVNLYAYVANDPVNAADPSGLAGCGSTLSEDQCMQTMEIQSAALDKVSGARQGLQQLRAERAEIASDARTELSAAAAATQTTLETYFKGSDEKTITSVDKVLSGIEAILQDDGSQYTYQLGASDWSDGLPTLGYASPFTSKIKLTPEFFGTDAFKITRGLQLETVIHEPAHVLGINVFPFQRETYGTAVIGLSRRRALNNADSYTQFSMH